MARQIFARNLAGFCAKLCELWGKLGVGCGAKEVPRGRMKKKLKIVSHKRCQIWYNIRHETTRQ